MAPEGSDEHPDVLDDGKWFDLHVEQWTRIMVERNSACPNPMMFIEVAEKKEIFVVMVTLDEQNPTFSSFIKDNAPLMFGKEGSFDGANASRVAYAFHTSGNMPLPPGVRCKESSRINFVGFSREKPGMVGQASMLVCINKDGKGKDTVRVFQVPSNVKQVFPPSMQPLFENPFFPASNGDGRYD